MVDRDRQRVRVDAPQRLEHQFALRPRVDEHDRHVVPLDPLQDPRRRRQPHMAGPRQPLGRQQDGEGRGGTLGHRDQPRRRPGPHIVHQRLRMRDRRRQPDPARRRRDRRQPRQAQRELVPTLGARQRVNLVDHDRPQRPEQRRRPLLAQQQREALRGGQQDVRRRLRLPLAPVRGRVASASLDADVERHLRHRRRQVARNVGRERLQRADIQGVQPRSRLPGQLDQAGQESGQRLPAPGRRHQQRAVPVLPGLDHIELEATRRPPAPREPARERFR